MGGNNDRMAKAKATKEARLECRPKGGGGEHAKSERPSG